LGHFVDSYRQASIDIMQGQTIDDEDLENCANELQTAACIAQALIPLSPPMYMSDIAPGPEMKFISVLYHMTRCVSAMTLTSCYLAYIWPFISCSYIFNRSQWQENWFQGVYVTNFYVNLKYMLFVTVSFQHCDYISGNLW